MNRLITIAILLVLAGTLSAQTHLIPSEPIISNDQRAGYYYSLDFGYGFGLGETDYPYAEYLFGATGVVGYQATRSIKTGLGLGVAQYDAGTLFPLYGQFRYSLWAKRVVPFFNADCGYLFSFEDFQGESRFFLNPSLGVHMVARDRLSVNVSSGILQQSGGLYGTSTFWTFKLELEFKGRAWNKFMIIK